MSKITNNENMKRYVHMKPSNGGSGSGSSSGCTCLPPMIIRGNNGNSEGVVPAEGSPTWSEAYAHILAGGLVYFISIDQLEPDVPAWIGLATYADDSAILFGFNQENGTFWAPASEDGDEES